MLLKLHPIDIISSQRRLIEEGNVELPDELRELYGLYQQEIHAGTVTATAAYERKLPPIYTAGYSFYNEKISKHFIYKKITIYYSSDSPCSSSGSEWSPSSPLPPIDGGGGQLAASSVDNLSQDNPDRHMGPAVHSRLPKLATTVGTSKRMMKIKK